MSAVATVSYQLRRRYLRGHSIIIGDDLQDKLAVAWRDGDAQAGERLVRGMLGLWCWHAIRIARRGIQLDEALSLVLLAVVRARDYYDPAKGLFRTYVWQLIRSEVQKYRSSCREIREPVSKRYRTEDLRSLLDEIEVSDEPSRSILERFVELVPADPPASIEVMEAWLFIQRARVMSYEQYFKEGHGEDTDARKSNVIAIDEQTPDEEFDRERLRVFAQHRVNEELAQLDPREKVVAVLRLMRDSDDALILSEIGASFGLSRERIRQIESGVIRKLRKRLSDIEPVWRDGLSSVR